MMQLCVLAVLRLLRLGKVLGFDSLSINARQATKTLSLKQRISPDDVLARNIGELG